MRIRYLIVDLLLRYLDSITNSMEVNLSKPREMVKDRGAGLTGTGALQPTGWQRVGHDLTTEQQQLSVLRSKRLSMVGKF